jgi:hypothetical protein
MIEINEIFSDSDKRLAWWCDGVEDTNDLAKMADDIIRNNIHLISVPPELVPLIWVYLEKSDVKILTRFVFAPLQKNSEKDMYDLAANITKVCKQGAAGVQVFIRMQHFEKFIEDVSSVRDDLFFGHDLCIAMDITDLDLQQWSMISQKLSDVRAKSLVLTLKEDMKNRSDFVGRIYGMLQNWKGDFELHLSLNNNFDRMDQVIRLVESEKPELSEKLRFFLDY